MGRFLASIYDGFMRKSEQACLQSWRAELLRDAEGDVLEIGAGTGANLAHYGAVDRLVLTEPDRFMRRKLEARMEAAGHTGEVLDAMVEDIPVADGSFDVVVITLLLCSVGDQARALTEIRRVLRDDGRLLFLEHVAAPNNPGRLRWQRRLEPIWKVFAEGCRLTCDTRQSIVDAGFEIETLQRESMRKALPWMRPTIRGVAVK